MTKILIKLQSKKIYKINKFLWSDITKIYKKKKIILIKKKIIKSNLNKLTKFLLKTTKENIFGKIILKSKKTNITTNITTQITGKWLGGLLTNIAENEKYIFNIKKKKIQIPNNIILFEKIQHKKQKKTLVNELQKLQIIYFLFANLTIHDRFKTDYFITADKHNKNQQHFYRKLVNKIILIKKKHILKFLKRKIFRNINHYKFYSWFFNQKYLYYKQKTINNNNTIQLSKSIKNKLKKILQTNDAKKFFYTIMKGPLNLKQYITNKKEKLLLLKQIDLISILEDEKNKDKRMTKMVTRMEIESYQKHLKEKQKKLMLTAGFEPAILKRRRF